MSRPEGRGPDLIVVGTAQLKEEHDALTRAAAASGAQASVVDPGRLTVELGRGLRRALIDGRSVGSATILPRGVNRVFPFLRTWLRLAEEGGAHVVNSISATERCLDKLITSELLVASGVEILPTIGRSGPHRNARADDAGPQVAKPALGSGGRGVRILKEGGEDGGEEGGGAVLEHTIVQPLADAAGTDVRAIVIGGRVAAMTRRTAPAGTFITNGEASSRVVHHGPEAAVLAERAVGAVGLTYAAVDLIEHSGGWAVLEVNCWPGLNRTAATTGVDLHRQVIEAALRGRMS